VLSCAPGSDDRLIFHMALLHMLISPSHLVCMIVFDVVVSRVLSSFLVHRWLMSLHFLHKTDGALQRLGIAAVSSSCRHHRAHASATVFQLTTYRGRFLLFVSMKRLLMRLFVVLLLSFFKRSSREWTVGTIPFQCYLIRLTTPPCMANYVHDSNALQYIDEPLCIGDAAHGLSTLHRFPLSLSDYRPSSVSWMSGDSLFRDATLLASCFRGITTSVGEESALPTSLLSKQRFFSEMARRYSESRRATERSNVSRLHSLDSLDDAPFIAGLNTAAAAALLKELRRQGIGTSLGLGLRAAVAGVASELSRTSNNMGAPRVSGVSALPASSGGEDALQCVLGFYVYAELSHHREVLAKHMKHASARLCLGGAVRIGRDGLNASIEGTRAALRCFADEVAIFPALAASLPIDFKLVVLSKDSSRGHVRGAGLLIKVVEELVALKLPQSTSHWMHSGSHLSPRAFAAALDNAARPEDAGLRADVLIDIRNSYESEIGHFIPPPGVKLLLPTTRTFSEVRLKLCGRACVSYQPFAHGTHRHRRGLRSTWTNSEVVPF